MTARARRVATETLHRGFGFAEGPVAMPDGSLAFCDGTSGLILGLKDASIRKIADVGGAPNGLALGTGGSLYAAVMGPWRDDQRAVAPSIARIEALGAVTTLATEAAGQLLIAPNDLAFSPDGRLYFTESGDLDHLSPARPSRIYAFGERGVDGALELAPCFANGIAFDAEGRLVWTETSPRRLCRLEGGSTHVLATFPPDFVPDGLAIALDGRIFVATVTSRAIVVVSPDGQTLDRFDVGAEPTNCAFAGSTLVITASTDSSGEPGTGLLLAVQTDAEPLPPCLGAA